MSAAARLLETRQLRKSFGALTVADGIDFALEGGARHALIGPNGAGKTTFVNLIAGVLAPSGGSVTLGGRDITGLDQAARVRRGVVRTFQISQLFRGLSVLENVALAAAERAGVGARFWGTLARHRRIAEESFAILERLGLGPDALRPVRELAYGRQRLVEIAIALALEPRVLLLDEPAAGVPSDEAHLILDVVDSLGEEIAVLIIEHDMDIVFRFAQRITVLVAGSVLTEGTPAEIAADARVRAVYLGERGHG